MKKTYAISGMSCDHCAARVRKALTAHPAVTDADVQRNTATATVTLNGPVAVAELQAALSKAGAYSIAEHNQP